MDIRIGVRDRRNGGWYYINNEVYDAGPSCEALTLYNAIARFANNETERAFFSGKKWKRHHKVGHAKLASAMRWLLDNKLIAPTGKKTEVGAVYFELLPTEHLKGVLPQNRGLFQGETGGCSTSEQGGVLPQNTNKTNNKTNNKTRKKVADGKAATPSLTRRVTDLIGEAHKHLTGSELVWHGHAAKYGKAIKTIIETVGKSTPEDEAYQKIREKCAAYVLAAKTDEFLKKQGVTPVSILSNWNKVHYQAKAGQSGLAQKKFPKYRDMTADEIKTAFTKWNKHFTVLDLKANISPESYERFTREANGYAPALVDILIEEVHKQKKSA